MKRTKRKPNPLSRKIVVKIRLNPVEMKTLDLKAHTYCKGNVSAFIREAIRDFKRKTEKET